MKIGIGLFWN